MLRIPLCGIKAVRLLRPVFRVEVACLIQTCFFSLFSIVCLLAKAEHSTTCPSRPAGQVAVGNLQNPTSQPQVWLAAPHGAAGFAAGTWPLLLCEPCFLLWPTETTVLQEWRGEAGRGGFQEVRLPSSNHFLQSDRQKHTCRHYLWRWKGKDSDIWLVQAASCGAKKYCKQEGFCRVLKYVFLCLLVFGF